MLAAARAASAATGVGIGVIIAANRTKHPLEARTLARLAGQYAGRGVIGFGLSNDERRGAAHEFAAAFRIAAQAGLLLTPHGGELAGPASVRSCLDDLRAHRIGHGVAAAADRELTKRLAGSGITLRCAPPPTWPSGSPPGPRTCRCARCSMAVCRWRWARTTRCCSVPAERPVRDRPARAHPEPTAIAELARMSSAGSAAPPGTAARLLAGIDAWLAAPSG